VLLGEFSTEQIFYSAVEEGREKGLSCRYSLEKQPGIRRNHRPQATPTDKTWEPTNR
jgi:hypothetical protein